MQNVTQKNNKLWLWIIFIVYPLGAFVYALKHFAVKSHRVFILLFFMFYGYTFLPIPNSDGSRYQEDFATTTTYSFSTYIDDLVAVFRGEASTPDFYVPTLKFVVHSFTNNSGFYFMLAAFVYFFIYLKLLNTIWELVAKDGQRYFMSFFIGCCFIYNLSAGVNAIRFPLAFMVFAYGALNLVLTNQRKYLLVAFVSVLIHFALSFSFVFLLLIYFFKFKINRWVLYLLLFLVAILGSIFPSFIEQNVGFLGDVSESKYEAYTQDGFVDTRVKHLQVWNWYVYFNFYSTYLFCLFSLLLPRLRIFKVKFDPTSEKLFVFAAIMLLHSLLSGNVVDVISNRYNLMFVFFTLVYLLYLSLKNRDNKMMRLLNYIYIPILVLNILVRFRGDLYTLNSIVVFGNVITAFFMDITISIQDLITS